MTGPTWRTVTPGSAQVLASDGRALASYSWAAEKNHPYFSNVRPTTHDGILTASAPWDHRWHHGLWWSWKFIDDVLYWEDHEDFGGNRKGLGRSVVVAQQVRQRPDRIELIEDLEWRETRSGRVALRERRVTTITEDAAERVWSIDWDLTWTSDAPVRFDVTSYPEHWWGGYAGLNFRAARAMGTGESIRASDGRDGVTAVHGQPVDWVSIAGNVDGAGTDDPDHPAIGGVLLIAHPDNAWGGRSAYTFSAEQEFGFAALAPLMHGGEELAADTPLRLRYRTTIFGEHVDRERLDHLAEAYLGAASRSQPAHITDTSTHQDRKESQ